MSRVKMNYTSQRQTPLTNMATLGSRLFVETVKSMGGIIEQIVDASAKQPASISLQPQKMCEIPETECPPYCVCEISWEATTKEQLSCVIKVTNSSDKRQLFEVTALPFPNPAGPIQITPQQLWLEAGQTAASVATYKVPERLAPGTYKTKILVAGAYEQCVCVTLQVQDKQYCECHITQGEIPTHTHTHNWYDHFQCEEPCFEPAKHRQKD
jgi:hypothetical protein